MRLLVQKITAAKSKRKVAFLRFIELSPFCVQGIVCRRFSSVNQETPDVGVGKSEESYVADLPRLLRRRSLFPEQIDDVSLPP